MRVDRRLLGWGVFFILLGAVPLAVRQGLVPADAVSRAWTLWPLLLISAGIGLLLRRTPLEFVGGLLTAATLGLIGGALIAGGAIPFGGCSSDRDSTAFPAQHGDHRSRQDLQRHPQWGIPKNSVVPAFKCSASYHLGSVTRLGWLAGRMVRDRRRDSELDQRSWETGLESSSAQIRYSSEQN